METYLRTLDATPHGKAVRPNQGCTETLCAYINHKPPLYDPNWFSTKSGRTSTKNLVYVIWMWKDQQGIPTEMRLLGFYAMS